MSLKAILHYEHLMELYEEGASSVETPLTDRFYVNPETVYGDDAKLFVDPVEQSPAKLNRRSAPARMMDLTGARQQKGAMFYAFNKKRLDSDLLHGLVQPDSHVIDRMGAREAKRQAQHFGKQHAILKELILAKVLANGEVYVDVGGNVLESASSDDETYTFGIAAGHQGQLDWDGGGAIIGTAWDDASADIQKDLDDIKLAARKSNAAVPTLAITNSNTKVWLRDNTDFRTWAAASFTEPDKLLRGDFREDLFDMDWFFYDGTYEDSSGTVRTYIPDGKVILVPADLTRWLRPMQGVTPVPTTLEPQSGADLASVLSTITESEGRFSFAKVDHETLTLNQYMGDSFGWVIANESAIWQATVDF